MRKRSNRQVRPEAIPCLITAQLVPEAQIALMMALGAFKGGWAGTPHFDALLDTRDLLLLGASAKRDSKVVAAADAINIALANIRDSWDGSKFAVSEDELNALTMLVDISIDFWARQSGNLYMQAYAALKKWRITQHEAQRQD